MSILNFVPTGWTLRPDQVEVLLEVEQKWKAEVLCITAPTAFGKSLLGQIIARFAAAQRYTVNIMAPSNVLIDQIKTSFPEIPVLHKRAYYPEPVQYAEARKRAKAAPIRLMNFHVCHANKIHGSVQILDEGHVAVDMLEDHKNVRIWQAQHPFPDKLETVADVIEWLQEYIPELPETSTESKKLRRALRDITGIRSEATIEYRRDMYRGHPSQSLVIMPGITRKPPDWLWPKDKVRKIVFLSATISREDIRELGLAKRSVEYIDCPSPIPPANRPVEFRPWMNMARQYLDKAMPIFAERLRQTLAAHATKGMVHIPYNLAEWLQDLIDDPRLIWHDKQNKLSKLQEFRDSPPEQGKVLIASGLYEGVDLPFDAARWQVIAKVPYLSLGDEKIKRRLKLYPDGYAWAAIKRIVQAAGRIVRAPDDYGVTYLWDTSFENLWREDKRREKPLFPEFFRDAVKMLPR